MYCPNCGKRIEDGSCNCRECGAAFVMMTAKKDHSETCRWLVLAFSVMAMLATVVDFFVPDVTYKSLDSTYLRYSSFNVWTFLSRGYTEDDAFVILIPIALFCGAALAQFVMMLIGGKRKGTVAVVLSSVMLALSAVIVGLLCYLSTIGMWKEYKIGCGAVAMVLCSLGAFVFSMIMKNTGKRRF